MSAGKKCEECVLINPVWGYPSEPLPVFGISMFFAEQLIRTNHSISTSDFAQLVDLSPFLLQCPSLNLSSNPDSMGWGVFLQILVFPNALPAVTKFPKRRIWSISETSCQWWCGQTCPSCLSLLLFFFDQSSVSPHCKCHPILSTAAAVICLLTDVTRQPWPSPGLRLAPDWTRSVTYAGFLFEYAVCASLDKKEN